MAPKRKAEEPPAESGAPPAKQKKANSESGDTLESVASRCRDNITGTLLVDPVIAEDGHTYERRAIAEWFRRRAPPTSPLTHEQMGTQLKQNYAIRAIVEDLATSPGLPRSERAEWHVARGKLHCERVAEPGRGGRARDPDARARAAFERGERLLEDAEGEGGDDPAARRLAEEASVCREICDRVLDKLARGTRVRVVDDRRAVLAAFEAQDDVLGLPDDWEESLGNDFLVENYDSNDSTYIIVKPDAFDADNDNTKEGKWWPYSVIALLA
ncbi:hypothetical protein JL722_11457 [Aureococcus anophagefferens]|nr:hypothetical protein JL722_11457 [Aureococcus anophagefferens]